MSAGHGNAGHDHAETHEQPLGDSGGDMGLSRREVWLGKVVDSGGGMVHLILHRDTASYPSDGADVVVVAGCEDWRELVDPDMAVSVAQESMRRVQEQNVQLTEALDQAGAAVGKVGELHEPRIRTRDGWTERWCGECGTDWPCKTTQVLAGSLEVGPEEMRR